MSAVDSVFPLKGKTNVDTSWQFLFTATLIDWLVKKQNQYDRTGKIPQIIDEPSN